MFVRTSFTFALMTTGAFIRNVGKLFSELWLVTDNLLLHESETFEQTVHRQEQNRMHMATSRTTCTAAPEVWHFIVSCPDPTLSRGKGSGDH